MHPSLGGDVGGFLEHYAGLGLLGHPAWERSCLELVDEAPEVKVELFEAADGAVGLQELLRKGARLHRRPLPQQLLGRADVLVGVSGVGLAEGLVFPRQQLKL